MSGLSRMRRILGRSAYGVFEQIGGRDEFCCFLTDYNHQARLFRLHRKGGEPFELVDSRGRNYLGYGYGKPGYQVRLLRECSHMPEGAMEAFYRAYKAQVAV